MAVSVLSSLSTGQSLIAGLDGGYVVTQSGSGSPSATLNLRPVDALSTVASTGTVTGEFIDESCCNNAGNAYLLTNASSTTRTLRSITQTGGAISVTSVGTFTVPTGAGNVDGTWLDPDNTQIVTRYSAITDFSAVNTGTGALDWTSTHSGHSGMAILACMGNDRYIAACATHGDVELWNGATDTLLDSFTRDSDRAFIETVVPLTSTSAFYIIGLDGTDPNQVRYGLLSTAGDALAWTWGPTDYTTAWTQGASFNYVRASAWGDTVAIGPGYRIYSGGYLSMPLYLIDTASQSVSVSASDVSVGYGVYEDEFWWAGQDSFAIHDFFTYATVTSWSVSPITASPTLLRQRQSPLRTPARIRGVDLRQRQTPYIT